MVTLVVILALVPWFAACSTGPSRVRVPDGVALVVDDWSLSSDELNDQLRQIAANEPFLEILAQPNSPISARVYREGSDEFAPDFVVAFLNERLSYRLISVELTRRGLEVTDADRRRALELLGQRWSPKGPGTNNPKGFDIPAEDAVRLASNVLAGFGSYRDVLVEGEAATLVLQEALVGPELADRVQALFNQLEAQGDLEVSCVRHILAKAGDASNDPRAPAPSDAEFETARAEAERVAARLAASEDFAVVAREVSDDAASAERGGDLGCEPRGTYQQEFDATVWSLAPGQVSGPVRSTFGYHIIEVTGRRTRTFDEVEPELKTLALGQMTAPLFEWLDLAKRKAVIGVAAQFGEWDEALLAIVPPGERRKAPSVSLAPLTTPEPSRDGMTVPGSQPGTTETTGQAPN
ncbi:MAG: peptidylprolyl isomerase [Acidimicrobiales bacterium]|nr:peptidylprolyl isomerase [Acidimicrobiales bacterium]